MEMLRLRLRRIFVDHIGIKAISLSLSLLLFFFVREGKQDARTLTVEVALNIPRGVVQTNEIARNVEFTVVGAKAVVDGIDETAIGLEIDLSPFGVGSSTLYLHKGLFTGVPHNASISLIKPSYLEIRLEKEDSRMLPITPMLKGQVAHGYRIDRYSLEPREATLIGPTSLVERTDFLETALINIAGATETLRREVPLKLPASNTRVSPSDNVVITVHIIEEVVERTFNNVAIEVPAATGVHLEPPAVNATLLGPLRLLETLTAEKLKAVAKVTPELLRPGRHQVTVQILDLPAQVAQVGGPIHVFLVVAASEEPAGRRPVRKGRESLREDR